MDKPILVLKLGTGIVTDGKTGLLDNTQIQKLAEVVSKLSMDYAVVIVSSGAVGAGIESLSLRERPTEISLLQACAAVGQARLMQVYESFFKKENLQVAQLLLTRDNFGKSDQKERIYSTLKTLMNQDGVIPVINENDSVAIEELAFGDNDLLGAEVAVLLEAKQYILLTGVDGVLDHEGNVVAQPANVEDVLEYLEDEKGKLSVGGMDSKLKAVQYAIDHNIKATISNGRKLEQLVELVAGKGVGTYFNHN